ncbi:FapA family protein [Paenibacillus sp. FSL K6-3166]|uniref:FapA family protein n=1 Tax=unclassified Paenibacillus TaxID=185978 RepID=UPI000BA0D901|nr:FapA family protein [Paenibacillus sp. VTT E-133291]OZQ78304.1 hypothetical protein CA598_29305 [Paenibacillus sp. VTT E-133291]
MTKGMTEQELTQLIKQLNIDEFPDETNKVRDTSKFDEWIQVKDQTIIVHDPTDGGKLPVISSASPVKIKVNDKLVESECVVSSTDRIHWEIDEKAMFQITVSKDKLHAYFHLMSRERYAWRLIDTEPMQNIIISAEELKDIVLETVHLADVVEHIERKSIKSNLDIASIQLELINPTYKPVLIAKGKAEVAGKDAQVEVYFPEQVESQFFEVSGNIDFRNHLQIPTVSAGDLIAKKIPLVDGIPGYDVYGNVLIPGPPKDIIVVTKPSVELTSDGEIFALKDGRPRITGGKIKTLDISTSYVVSGDVDIESGNIVFSGDVIVYGNVTDKMIIESLGNVYVYGSAYNAIITATGSIFVRGNVLGSKLYCGYFGVMFNRLYTASKTLGELMDKLLIASKILVQELELRKQKIRFGQIIILLMENKFKEIPTIIREMLDVLTNFQHIKKEEYQKLREMSAVFMFPSKLLEVATSSFIQSFVSLLQETHQEVARMQEEKTEIILNQCYNSDIKSNGDIIIKNDGVILSDLYAARHIVFKRDTSVCRGSHLEAGGSIVAKVIGGQSDVITLLKANRKITIKKMFSGRVCIGKRCIDIYDVVENKTFNADSFKQRA